MASKMPKRGELYHVLTDRGSGSGLRGFMISASNVEEFENEDFFSNLFYAIEYEESVCLSQRHWNSCFLSS